MLNLHNLLIKILLIFLFIVNASVTLAQVAKAQHIQELVYYLGSSFADVNRINIKIDLGDIYLDFSQAMPLGLNLNEAITNAVRYAFPGDQHGTVIIFLDYVDTENIILQIKDNGRGLPEDFNLSDNNSLGIQLIQLFAEQLEGKLQVKIVQGVEISLFSRQFHPESNITSLLNTE